ncbi:hypothetical protein PT974_04402 [Cladobotryum mycophilum]|uniref:Reverse transcriptase domain-containing protein n=1 Tax=Cladobotryum mycophilum TaxID=491253 RepID=A0ABR0SUZ5_9HYPO
MPRRVKHLLFPQGGYEAGDGISHMPLAFRDGLIKKMYLEFLPRPADGLFPRATDEPRNHVIIKLDLESTYDNVEGAIISMEMGKSISMDQYNPGHFKVEPVGYAGVSDSSVRTFLLHARSDIPLGQMLHSIQVDNLHQFAFFITPGRSFGGRDWMAQLILQLNLRGHLLNLGTTTVQPATNVLSNQNALRVLGLRYRASPAGEPFFSSIQCGFFTWYKRVRPGGIPYEGTLVAAEVELDMIK